MGTAAAVPAGQHQALWQVAGPPTGDRPGGGGAGREGLGRSRGGFTTKLHLSADGRCRPLSLTVTPGQRADCAQFKPVMEKIRVPKLGPGRPRKKPDSVAADKADSNGPCRGYLRRRGIRHTIPERTDSQATCLRKGSRGGRPPGFDGERYKKHNTVERAVNRLKQHRAKVLKAPRTAPRTAPRRQAGLV
ncbi:transposase [Streptomyces sp. 4.24]|uniref:transposase n=1 Tax=Streptomyces tritrimontium TaxID=3406573 RepID=UPI003BB66E82